MSEGNRAAGAAPAAALFAGAFVWGLVWYPYRLLRDAGIGGIPASTTVYLIALLPLLVIWRPRLRLPAQPWLLFFLALAAGGTNLGYVMATLLGEVVRVLLLFYLAPLWTVPLSWLILGERLGRRDALVVALALCGAVAMLWRPEIGLPLPRDAADWIGLGAGFCFALFGVLSRRARALPATARIRICFVGIVALGVCLGGIDLPALHGAAPVDWLLLLALGGVMLAVNFAVQFGLAHTPANRAMVIMLAEVGFAAISSWLLAGESMGPHEWASGAVILAASLLSATGKR